MDSISGCSLTTLLGYGLARLCSLWQLSLLTYNQLAVIQSAGKAMSTVTALFRVSNVMSGQEQDSQHSKPRLLSVRRRRRTEKHFPEAVIQPVALPAYEPLHSIRILPRVHHAHSLHLHSQTLSQLTSDAALQTQSMLLRTQRDSATECGWVFLEPDLSLQAKQSPGLACVQVSSSDAFHTRLVPV